MKVLGPALITNMQQDKLVDGAVLNVPHTAVYLTTIKRAKVGDRLWVREPYVEFSPMRFGAPQHLHAIAHGHSPTAIIIPPSIKPYLDNCRLKRRDGSDMTRAQSRASLEILQVMADGMLFHCVVHMGNVDGLIEVAA